MLSAQQARDYVSRMARVKVYSGAAGFEEAVLAEGNVMSYIDAPSVELLHDDGKLKSWSTRLRIEEVDAPKPETEREFMQAVARARIHRRWSQEMVADRLSQKFGVEIHQTGIARIEAGTRRIRLDEAIALAKLLDIQLHVGGNGQEADPCADGQHFTLGGQCQKCGLPTEACGPPPPFVDPWSTSDSPTEHTA